jgi:lysophospholipid acyltransferase (LPLAT)-like uncharacterized protein
MLNKVIKQFYLFIVSLLSGPLLRLYFLTLRIKEIGNSVSEEKQAAGDNMLYALWHENMMVPLFTNRGKEIHVLVSQHLDGEIITRILHSFGFRTVRGSSTRGGLEALLYLQNVLDDGIYSIAITPDGPRGPRRKAKFGAIKLASLTGKSILPVSVAVTRCKRLKSWDKFLLVLPFSRCVVVYGEPYCIPKNINDSEIKNFSEELEHTLNKLDETAEKWLQN